ncbi:hypothetical protein EW145_g428 [Phellinidium pouzarii]|uniref:Uncharacterized protein n=1 Tax=Phellinidium pouzarii TaxID=167371 RepID=A0A4V3XE08_9AGAM|nr:hypothetical protein EW145_g428 [Phellinidium pouzarii]
MNTLPPVIKSKISTKKRKRTPDADDLPVTKQPRSDNEDIVMNDVEAQASEYPPLAGELPLKDEDAQKILDVLEMVDTQGLLDRVFPLDDVLGIKAPSSPSSSKAQSDSYSLRTLLKESNEHPLRVYRSAIKQLFPISSQPRSRISPPAAQQRGFCQLALSLIEQASQHTIECLSLKPELVLPDRLSEDESSPTKEDPDVIDSRRKYALMQKLPTGEWWSSLNSDLVGADAKPLNDLGTAYAELIATMPSSSSTSKPTPTLGELHISKKVQTKIKLPGPRPISCGSFLDYGPYASFAPSFDNDGCDVGRIGVSNVLWRRHEKGKAREKARILGERIRQKLAAQAGEKMEIEGVMEIDPVEARAAARQKEKELLGSLVVQEECDPTRKLLDALEREENANELLARNAKALLRLEELQRIRLSGEKGGSSNVKVGSEEWNIAQRIMDSLTLITSMRPRLPNGSASAILPPASVLRALHQTLPSEPSQGWYGTLTGSRGLALRDDTTLHVKASSSNQAPAPVPAPTPAPQTPAPAYSSNYSYANYSQQYRNNPSQAYTREGQPGSYFPNGYSQGGSTPQTQKTQLPYQTQFSGGSQYPYASWFQGQSAAGSGSGTPGPGSRKGTPQPAAAMPAIPATGYAPYSAAVTSATPARAVANTVATKVQTNGWATPGTNVNSGYGAPTLPLHMRATDPVSPSVGPVSPLVFNTQNVLTNYQQAPPANS